MATDEQFDDYEVVIVRRPVAGVEQGEIPAKLAKLLAEHVATLTREDGTFDPDRELIIRAKDEKQGDQLKGYAKAWGARQDPQLRITKLGNGKRYQSNVVRLKIELESEVTEDNRPGRRRRR